MQIENIPEEAVDLLAEYCDFQIGATPSGLSMLPESQDLKLIAGDGMGGCFYEWLSEENHNNVPIVYLSEYGETSRVANNLQELLSFLVQYEDWGSVLTAASKGREIFNRVTNSTEMDKEREVACLRLKELVLLSDDVSAEIFDSINKKPEFCPKLITDDGVGPASSFKERPYPK
jgi:hypothetical protein